MNYIFLIFNIFFVLLFLLTATDKVKNWSKHVDSIRSYKIIPEKFVKTFLVILIIGEFFLGISILLWNINIFNTILFLALISAYTLAISINLLRGNNEISCGCGSILENEHLSVGLIYRNIILMLIYLTTFIKSDISIFLLTLKQFFVFLMITVSLIFLWGIIKEIFYSKKVLRRIQNIIN